MSKITDHLLPTERALWQGKPELKAYIVGGAKIAPIIIGVILVDFSLVLMMQPFLLQSIQNRDFLNIIILLIGLGLVGIYPLINYIEGVTIEYLITNQRVIIHPNSHAEGAKIINLYEVTGQIEMKYNKFNGTGSIWIPTPHWDRVGIDQSSTTIFGKSLIGPDIKDIKEPHKVYDILIEAIADGKATKWK